jgi:hypothetical protein
VIYANVVKKAQMAQQHVSIIIVWMVVLMDISGIDVDMLVLLIV